MLNHKGEFSQSCISAYVQWGTLQAWGKKKAIRALCEGILTRRKWFRFEEMKGRERNSQADTQPCSKKINTGTDFS